MRWFARAQVLLLTPARVREVHRTGEPGRVASTARREARTRRLDDARVARGEITPPS